MPKNKVLKKRGKAKLMVALLAFALLAVQFVTQNANASAYTYTENFDNDTAGSVSASNPTEAWYSLLSNDFTVWDINTTQAHSGTQSLHGTHDGSASHELDFALNQSATIEYCQFYTYMVSQKLYIIFANATYNAGNADSTSLDANAGPWIIIDSTNVNYKDSTGTVQSICSSAGMWNTWVLWNISFDYTNHQFSININGTSYGPFSYRNPVDDIKYMVYWLGSGYSGEWYIDDIEIGSPADIVGEETSTNTIDISLSISPDADGDGRLSFGSTNQTNVSMDSVDFLVITENGNATVANITITMQNIGGAIPTYYGGATNCYVYKWVGTGAPTSVDLSDTTNWQQAASFDSTATITGLSLGQGQSVYLAFRILDNDPENDGIAAGTYESSTTAHSVTAS